MSTANETKAVKPFGFKDKLGYMGNEMLQKMMAKMSLQDLLKQAGEKAVPKEAVKQKHRSKSIPINRK